MNCRQWIRQFDMLAPKEYACGWDNPGFQAGRADKEIKRILVALDATDEVVEQAVSWQADLLVTHHPLIFKPLKLVNDENFISRRIVSLIQADICYFAMHTNFDAAPGCMADLAAGRLGLLDGEPLEVTGEADGLPIGIGKKGRLPAPVSLKELALQVKQAFGLPFVTVYGSEQVREPIERIAVSPGAGGSMIEYAVEAGAQALVTGDIGHHSGIDAAARHMAVIDAGHYGLEHIFIPFMAEYIRRHSGGTAEVMEAAPAFPAQVF
ncbi:MAG: Nif3-like dinuclear metal center hexameric protein [Eubacteriales bacterium]|nr:Nif3-like dinuclear metal center hexameric protein [Eubacteriales bacterium]